jgi:hypothetical protein
MKRFCIESTGCQLSGSVFQNFFSDVSDVKLPGILRKVSVKTGSHVTNGTKRFGTYVGLTVVHRELIIFLAGEDRDLKNTAKNMKCWEALPF